MKRLARVAIALGTASMWLGTSGCLTFEGRRAFVPFFEIYEGVAPAAGAGKAAVDPLEGGNVPATEYVLRPLGSYESIGSRRSRVQVAWPLGDFSWGAGFARHWILPVFYYRHRPDREIGESDVDFMLFPFIYAGYEPGEGGYFGVLPLGGTLRGLLAKDETVFVLFPLYWHTWNEGKDSLHLFWPFFNRLRGGGRSGWRIWPFYGTYEAEDRDGNPRYHRRFILWPFYIRQSNQLNSHNPSELFFTFPLYGHSESPRREVSAYLWPLVQVHRDKREENGVTVAGFIFPFRFGEGQIDVWPFFGWKTRHEREAMSNFTALFDEDDAPGEDDGASDPDDAGSRTPIFRQFALWPIQRYESEETPTSRSHRFWLLPLLWRFWSEKDVPDNDGITSEWKVWPLFRYRRDPGETTLYLPSPHWFRQEDPFERQWARLWRLFLYRDTAERSGWELAYGLFSHRHEKASEESTWSVLYGLLELTTGPASMRFRFLYLPWR